MGTRERVCEWELAVYDLETDRRLESMFLNWTLSWMCRAQSSAYDVGSRAANEKYLRCVMAST